ncbi:MAG: DNA polymerase IV [Coriobacteriia bacterium]|nr:DNA polymerase IV [Coriobacteriia bacterium]
MAEHDSTSARNWAGRAVLHVDMDAFFAAVEQLDHPGWRGRPVIVGGDPARRGVVSAASYEARRFGVRSAMPSARAAALCPDAVWARPRGERYRDVSRAVREIFRSVTPHVQPTSIDEAYLDATPGAHSGEHPLSIASRIRDEVDRLGVSCSIGIATNKTVAKIASDRDKPHGITVVPPGEEASFLSPLPVRLMPGIGSVTASRLERLGITTLGDVAALDELTAREVLGSWGPELVDRCRGIDLRPVRDNPPAKSVSNERTFAEDAHTAADVRSVITALAGKVAGRLRAKHLSGRTVTLKVRYGDFSTRTVRRTLPAPTDARDRIVETTLDLLDEVWSPGVGVRLIGVGLSGFEERAIQMDLLDEAPVSDPVLDRLAESIDEVHRRFGSTALRHGAHPARDTGTPPQSPGDREGDERSS